MTALAAIFDGTPKQLRLVRVDRPAPRADELLVRVLGCTLCGSDLHSYEGRRSVPIPTVLGHEIVGELVASGRPVSATDAAGLPLQVGDRVTWAIVASCGTCRPCRDELPQKCSAGVKYGHEALAPGIELRGGLATHCLLAPGTTVVKLPSNLPLEVACPASCATATVVAALEPIGDLRGRSICVFGAGLLGLTAAAMCDAAGANVICVDPDAGRRARALQFGAAKAIAPGEVAAVVQDVTGGYGVDAVVELSGANSAWPEAWPIVRTGGRLILVGAVVPGPMAAFEQQQLIRRHLSVHGIHNYAPRHLGIAVDFLSRSHAIYPFADLVAGWYPLEQVETAFRAASDPGVIRIGVRPDLG